MFEYFLGSVYIYIMRLLAEKTQMDVAHYISTITDVVASGSGRDAEGRRHGSWSSRSDQGRRAQRTRELLLYIWESLRGRVRLQGLGFPVRRGQGQRMERVLNVQWMYNNKKIRRLSTGYLFKTTTRKMGKKIHFFIVFKALHLLCTVVVIVKNIDI